jgi:hypothetical protein
MSLFKKKQGGTRVGNFLGKALSTVTGGILGGKRAGLLDSGNAHLINAPSNTPSMQTIISAAMPIGMPLPILPELSKSDIPKPTLGDKIAEVLKTSDGNTGFGMAQNLGIDPSLKTPLMIGLGLFALSIFMKKGR